MDINEIKKILPHRYPFLLVDRVLSLKEGESCTAVKNVTANEEFFMGHFPEYPVMPGVLIVEALAQTAGIAVYSQNTGASKKIGLFASIENMRFKKPVIPGDTLTLEAVILSNRMNVVKAKVTASVNGEMAAEGEIKFMMVNTPE